MDDFISSREYIISKYITTYFCKELKLDGKITENTYLVYIVSEINDYIKYDNDAMNIAFKTSGKISEKARLDLVSRPNYLVELIGIEAFVFFSILFKRFRDIYTKTKYDYQKLYMLFYYVSIDLFDEKMRVFVDIVFKNIKNYPNIPVPDKNKKYKFDTMLDDLRANIEDERNYNFFDFEGRSMTVDIGLPLVFENA